MTKSFVHRGAGKSGGGVGVVGLHQPLPEERHGGAGKGDTTKQGVTDTGWDQVSVHELQGVFHKY